MRSDVKKYNILFIAQTLYLSRSLILHLKNCDDNADIMTERKLFGKNINVEYVKNTSLKNRIGSIYECVLPISYCYIGRSNSFIHVISSKIKSLFHFRLLRDLCLFIKNKNYSYVHINSLILHKLVSEEYPCILHIRERYDGSDPSVYDSLMKAKGVIFIDNTVYEPFKHLDIEHKLILNNPVSMFPQLNAFIKKPIDKTKTIFTYVGRLEEDKGISLIIDAFKQSYHPDSILLIVGDGETNYVNKMMNMAVGHSDIIFYGVEDDIQIIYDISDYIIRGESQQCVGRTMYEGLYSGCEVIIPGNDLTQVFEGEKFKHMIHFYEPNNVNDLKRQFEIYNGKKITVREYGSNIKDYLQKFNVFIEECLNEKT